MSDGSIFSQTIGNADVVIGAGDWTSIVSGNGRYVAIGDNTLAAKRFSACSDNGTDWTYKEQKTVFTWSGNVVYGNGKFVTSGTDANSYERGVLSSTDGVDWSFTQLSGNVVLQSIIYTDKFIGIDTKGNIFTSANGTDWTSQATDMSIGNVCENRGLAYGNDIYVDFPLMLCLQPCQRHIVITVSETAIYGKSTCGLTASAFFLVYFRLLLNQDLNLGPSD